jgi:hypothetical protein
VVEHPGLFLGQDDNAARSVCEPFEHQAAPSAPLPTHIDFSPPK